MAFQSMCGEPQPNAEPHTEANQVCFRNLMSGDFSTAAKTESALNVSAVELGSDRVASYFFLKLQIELATGVAGASHDPPRRTDHGAGSDSMWRVALG